ncbi:hypothetical protein GCM10023086_19710 [Streptomyces venetus]|uniref:Uncharacterized protein n=1 Tax=Streptomyces venetus TaxID=1701086 RepID=A0ABP8FGU2_9ACTN
MPQLGEVRREQPVGDGLAVDEYAVVVEDHEVIAHGFEPKRRKPPHRKVRGFSQKLFGGVLLSHRVPPAVPSAL